MWHLWDVRWPLLIRIEAIECQTNISNDSTTVLHSTWFVCVQRESRTCWNCTISITHLHLMYAFNAQPQHLCHHRSLTFPSILSSLRLWSYMFSKKCWINLLHKLEDRKTSEQVDCYVNQIMGGNLRLVTMPHIIDVIIFEHMDDKGRFLRQDLV